MEEDRPPIGINNPPVSLRPLTPKSPVLAAELREKTVTVSLTTQYGRLWADQSADAVGRGAATRPSSGRCCTRARGCARARSAASRRS